MSASGRGCRLQFAQEPAVNVARRPVARLLHVVVAVAVEVGYGPELQEKIDALVTRMERNYGYTKESARDVLIYVSSIFARGDIVKK